MSQKKEKFFGKKHKSIYEQSCCFYQSIEAYIQDMKSHKTDNDKMEKLVSSDYFNKSLNELLKHADQFEFEDKKKIYNMLKQSLIESKNILSTPINYTEQYFKTIDFEQTIDILCNYHTENLLIRQFFFKQNRFSQMSFFVGNTLRIITESTEVIFCFFNPNQINLPQTKPLVGKYLKLHIMKQNQQVILKQQLFAKILSVDLIRKIVNQLSSNRFEMQSEVIETLNHFFMNKFNSNIKSISSQLLKDNANECIIIFNQILEKSESYTIIRMLLRTLYKILSDPIYKSFACEYLKNIDNLKIIMTFTANEDSGIKKEALLFLDLFINLLEEQKDENLKSIFQRNYKNLISIIKNFNDDSIEGEKEEQDKVDTLFLIHRLHAVSF